MYYWDTSTLVKLYVSESDSSQFVAHLSMFGPAMTSELARWELFRVLARKEAEGMIAAKAAEVVFAKFSMDAARGRIRLLPMDLPIEAEFRRLVLRLQLLNPALLVRTLDGIHIATAVAHGASEFVATDVNMRKCAAAAGLKLYP